MNAAAPTTTPSLPRLHEAARDVFAALQETHAKVALAESCTGGLVSGLLAGIPGMSKHLCGSLVVYSNEAKTQWLGIPEALLNEKGPVSRETAEKLATAMLDKTPAAELALSVTGHLGPHSQEGLDGIVWVGWAHRAPRGAVMGASQFKLGDYSNLSGEGRRLTRQLEASEKVLNLLAERLDTI